MAYTLIEQQTRDIDLFFRDRDKPIHIATGGGSIPNQLAENDANNESFLVLLNNLSPVFEIEVNPFLLEILQIGQQNLQNYLSDFIQMAQFGFYSYDKSNLGDFEDPFFHLVARPKHNHNDDFLPKDLLPKLEITLPSDYKSFDLFNYFISQ